MRFIAQNEFQASSHRSITCCCILIDAISISCNNINTLFQATVNNNCNFTAIDEEAALTLGSNGKVLSGETTTLKIKCNYGVELGLELAADGNNPETTTNASTITLDGASSALTAGTGGKYALGNANGVEQSFKLGMTATSANAQLLPGAYKYTVTMTLVAAASE